MGLIPSPRHRPGDVEHWRTLERYDRMLARSPELDRAVERARSRIEAFAAAGLCHLATSWGRDSVVVLHLAHGLDLPAVHAIIGPGNRWQHKQRMDNPDVPAVRDAYLDRWPIADYHELPFGVRDTRNGPVEVWPRPPGHDAHRPITGIRADESGGRKMSMRGHGHTTANTCRPIIDWPSRLVWAYLARHDLPVHPAYACTLAGVLDRCRLRVHNLGGDKGAANGRWEWENAYYPEALTVRARTI